VNNTETDEMLKIRVMNISKNDLGKTLKKFKGTAWDQSPLFKKMYEKSSASSAASPTAASWRLLLRPQRAGRRAAEGMAQIAAAAHAPFIAAPRPRCCRWNPGRSWPTRAT
jgi:type VI secretion system protein ImpC